MVTARVMMIVAMAGCLAQSAIADVQDVSQYWFGLGTVNGIAAVGGGAFDTLGSGSDNRLTIRTESTAAGAITMSNGSYSIDGDIIVGAGGNPSQVISLSSTSSVNGSLHAATSPINYPSVIAPSDLLNSVSKGIAGGGTVRISESGRYDAIDAQSLVIDAPVSLYVSGSVSYRELDIIGNGSLALYLGGNVVTLKTSLVNTQSQDARRLQIYGLDTCTRIDIGFLSQFYGTVYAPQAEFRVGPNSSICGAVVSNSCRMSGYSSFTYDASVPEPATVVLLGLGGMAVAAKRHRSEK
jgi:hypothetical protein